jgi:hypothetical protein
MLIVGIIAWRASTGNVRPAIPVLESLPDNFIGAIGLARTSLKVFARSRVERHALGRRSQYISTAPKALAWQV